MTEPRIVPANRASRTHLDLIMREGGDAHGCRCQRFTLGQAERRATRRAARDDAPVRAAMRVGL